MKVGEKTKNRLVDEDLEIAKKELLSTRGCLGIYEDESISWHCKGCLIKNECKKIRDRREGQNV